MLVTLSSAQQRRPDRAVVAAGIVPGDPAGGHGLQVSAAGNEHPIGALSPDRF
jgi:hypothetical protein